MYYYQQKRLRRIRRFALLAALAVACAAGIALGDRSGPSLEVKGKAAPGKRTSAATDVPAESAQAKADAAFEAALRAPKLVGDAALRGRIDLTKMQRDGDGFSVPIDAKRRARLTIDPALQEEADKLLKRAKAPKAAIVVMAPDGRILALAGRKGGPTASEEAYELATTTWAPAASVFKLVTAAALLEAGVGADDQVCFHGGLRSVMKTNLTDSRRDNRCESLSFAVAESNNAIMGKLAHKHLDAARVEKAANAFGILSPPAFALAADASRIEPPADELEFAQFAAGFWSSELSALDGALLTSVIANGGMRVQPRIVAEVVDASGASQPVVPPSSQRAVTRRVADEIGRMMVRTTKSGTAARAFSGRRAGTPLHGVEVAGKTGSLSVVKPSYLGISWFVAYAPADRPEYIVSIVLGNPESWWLKAHTAARSLLEKALAEKPAASKTATAK